MRLTQFSDYGLRVLTYLGVVKTRSSIHQVSRALRVSENHLAMVVHRLSRLGYVRTFRGKGGGIELGMSPSEMNIGRIVEQLEPDFAIAECLDGAANGCQLAPECRTQHYFDEARRAFLRVLHRYRLADVLANQSGLRRRLAGRHTHRTHQWRKT